MASLTTEQMKDFREDIADQNKAFGDEELQRLYTRSNGNYDAALVLALEQLLANTAKFHDYSANQSDEERSQIFEHLKDLLAIKQARLAGTKTQVKLVRLKGGQYKKAEKPHAGYD